MKELERPINLGHIADFAVQYGCITISMDDTYSRTHCDYLLYQSLTSYTYTSICYLYKCFNKQNSKSNIYKRSILNGASHIRLL